MQLPVEEKFLSTRNELKDNLAILPGGRVAEEIVYGDVSSGAANDLERASEIARDMVTRLGMSDETAQQIDSEIRALIEDGHRQAREILQAQLSALDALASRLQEKEVLTDDEARDIIKQAGV